MSKKQFWFYLEPYIHLSVKNDHILFYNPLNAQTIEYLGQTLISNLVKKLQYPKNNWVIKLTEIECTEPQVFDFIKKIKDTMMGDLLDTLWSDGKPVQVFPLLNLQSDPERFKKKLDEWVGEEMMINLREVSLCLNNYTHTPTVIFEKAIKQFLCPVSTTSSDELKLQDLKQFIKQAQSTSLSLINITGGNIFKYSQFNELVSYLSILRYKIRFYIYYLEVLENIEKLNIINIPNSEIIVIIDFPINFHIVANCLKLLNNRDNISIKYIIQNDEDLKIADSLN